MTIKLARLAILFFHVGHSILDKNYFSVLTDQASVGTSFLFLACTFYSTVEPVFSGHPGRIAE